MDADPPPPPSSPSPPSSRPRRLPDFAFVAVTVAHFVLYLVLAVSAFSMGMSRFDKGGPARPAEHAARAGHSVLSFPLVLPFHLMGTPVRGPAQWVLLLANSMCWGYGASWTVDQWRRP